VAAVGFVAIGIRHLVAPDFFIHIVPPGFGPPALMVAISGACEIAGGVGLLIPVLRRAAAIGLIALLAAVFPANIYMVIYPDAIPDFHVGHWILWARLPLQPLFIAWVWYAALRKPRSA
jgi:uncharacterized membrane protein